MSQLEETSIRQARVVVLGAGPGGACAAMQLARNGIPCTLVDKAVFPRDKICGDALSGKVVEMLNRLDPGMMDRFEAEPAALGCWGVTFVSPSLEALSIPFRLDPLRGGGERDQAPGFIAKRVDFDDFLVREVRKRDRIELLENTRVSGFERTEQGWLLHTTGEAPDIACDFIIAADGAQSLFARKVAGLEVDPRHHSAAIRAYYRGVEGMHEDNYIELHYLKDFLPGYFWIFPLPDGRANVGLGMRSDQISRHRIDLKRMLPEIIERYPGLKARFRHAELDGPVKGFGLPLGSRRAPLSGDGYLLVGDAGSLIDPFTGEGIGNAIISGMLAADRCAEALAADRVDSAFLGQYDENVYRRLGHELSLSYRMQRLVAFPWLFNFVVRRANRSSALRELITCMFEDLELRSRLRQPSFYFKLLFSR